MQASIIEMILVRNMMFQGSNRPVKQLRVFVLAVPTDAVKHAQRVVLARLEIPSLMKVMANEMTGRNLAVGVGIGLEML